MFRLILTSAWTRKRRLVATSLAIILGVSFLSATLVLGDSARAGFETAFTEANSGTDAFVRSAQELTSAEEATRPPIPSDLVAAIRDVPGVASVTPVVEGSGQVLDPEGDPIGGTGPPTVAAGWIDQPALTGWEIVDGRPPEAAGEVVIDRATAEAASASPGDRLRVLVPEPVEVTVVGIVTFGDDDSIGGSTYVAFPMAQAQELLLGSEALVTGVIAAGRDHVSEEELVAAIASRLPDGLEALTGTELTREQQEDIEGDFLGFLTTALIAFALTALVVAAFSIFNTFSILAAHRTRESALLRAIGASRRQILASALVESLAVGVVGAAVGAGAGILLASGVLALMEGAGFGLPTDGLVVSPASLAVALSTGVVVTIAAASVPAWRASRVPPLAALRDVAIDTSGVSRTRILVGAALTAVGATAVLATTEGSLVRPAVGAVLLLAGVIVLGPVVARPVAHLLGAPLALRGVSGLLARRNAVRNPHRTAATATALLVGVGIVSLFTVFGASVSASIEDQIDRSFAGDLAVRPAGGFSGAGLSPALVDQIAALPEVEAAAGLGFGAGTIDGDQEGIGFSDPAQLAAVADFDVVEGDLATIGQAELAMSAEHADDGGYEVGDVVELGFPDGTSTEVTLAATYDARAIGGDVLVAADLWTARATQSSYYLAFVGLADGVDSGRGAAAVAAVTGPAGSPEVMDRNEFVESQAAEIDALLTVIYALLAIAIVIALMGIANTMSLSVHERTRELGLLRAVGQARSQLRAMVRWESVIVSTFGALGGLGVGMFLSWGLVRSLNAAEGFGRYSVPVGSLLVIVAVGAFAGLLAGLRPAWRASRIDVLDAVAAE